MAAAVFAGCAPAANEQNAMKNYRTAAISEVKISPAQVIGQEWMLITAGAPSACNTMTASWGQLGHLWNKNVATMYIRPQRYTKQFVDSAEVFTLSFFREKYRDALTICGTKSGRDGDKIREAGLTPIATPAGSTAFEEAYMIMECRKLYVAPLYAEAFVDTAILPQMYPNEDFHTMYIGEILNIYVK